MEECDELEPRGSLSDSTDVEVRGLRRSWECHQVEPVISTSQPSHRTKELIPLNSCYKRIVASEVLYKGPDISQNPLLRMEIAPELDPNPP